MNLRSSSRESTNSLNSSRGRGRTVLPLNTTRSLEDFPITPFSGGRLVHSPPPGENTQMNYNLPSDREQLEDNTHLGQAFSGGSVPPKGSGENKDIIITSIGDRGE